MPVGKFSLSKVTSPTQLAPFYKHTEGFGGTGSWGAYASAGNETIQEERHYTSFNVALADTVSCGNSTHKMTILKVQGNMTISGILKSATVGGGAANGAGSNGATNVGTAPTGGVGSTGNGGGGGGGVANVGGASGGGSAGGARYIPNALQPYANLSLLAKLHMAGGGGGGGGAAVTGGGGAYPLLIDVAGNLTCTGSILADGAAGNAGATGGGGGGGGLLVIRVGGHANFAGGTVAARGGAGGNGNTTHGGGGGGGGWILILASKYTAPTVLNADGGAGGTKTGAGVAGTAGSNGYTDLVQGAF